MDDLKYTVQCVTVWWVVGRDDSLTTGSLAQVVPHG